MKHSVAALVAALVTSLCLIGCGDEVADPEVPTF